MTVADGSQTRLAFIPEVTIGTIPTSPAFQIMRYESESITLAKQTSTPNEIRFDRNSPAPVDIGRMVDGPVNTKLSYGTYDVWLEHLFASAWSTNVLKNGILHKAGTFEKTFDQGSTDSYIRYTGCRFNTLDINIASRQEVSAVWGISGITSPTPTTGILSGATYTAATTTEIFNAGLNVAAFNMASTTLVSAPKIQSLTVSMRNNIYPIDVVGQYYPYSHGLGRFEVSGSVRVLFESLAIYTAIIGHEDVAITFTLQDAAGNSYAFSIPKVKLMSGGPVVAGNNQPVVVDVPFTAFYDTSSSASISITRAAA